MALLLKTKPKPEELDTAASTIAVSGDPEVDELVALLAWAKKQTEHPKFARLKELKAQFIASADKLAASDDDEVRIKGRVFELKFGAKSKDRFIKDVEKLAELVEEGILLEIATFPIGKVDNLLTGAQKKEVFGVNRGSRSMGVETLPQPLKKG